MGDIEEDEGSHNRGDNNDDDKQMNASAPTWTLAICATPVGEAPAVVTTVSAPAAPVAMAATAGAGVGTVAVAGATPRTNKGQHDPSKSNNREQQLQ